jgi:hypothetical protein
MGIGTDASTTQVTIAPATSLRLGNTVPTSIVINPTVGGVLTMGTNQANVNIGSSLAGTMTLLCPTINAGTTGSSTISIGNTLAPTTTAITGVVNINTSGSSNTNIGSGTSGSGDVIIQGINADLEPATTLALGNGTSTTIRLSPSGGSGIQFLLTGRAAGLSLRCQDSSGTLAFVNRQASIYSKGAGGTLTANSNRMVGCAFSFTPSFSGNITIGSSAYCSNATGSGVTITTFWNYGTGTAPTANAAATGTSIGLGIAERIQAGLSSALGLGTASVTGLSVGTTYWLDIQCNSDNLGGTASISNVNATVSEY